MVALSSEQIEFLTHHRIASSLIFDATGMRTSDYKAAMRKNSTCFAIGVTPCGAAGHTLRTRAGHCVQCDPSKISYMLRYVNPGLVYIAGSQAGRLLKIGSAEYVFSRQDSLRNSRYADQSDWRMLAHAECREAGKAEGELQAALAPWRAAGEYLKGSAWQQCYELFRCGFDRAFEGLQTIADRSDKVVINCSANETRLYNFEP